MVKIAKPWLLFGARRRSSSPVRQGHKVYLENLGAGKRIRDR